MTEAAASRWGAVRRQKREYEGEEDRPLGSFLVLMGAYAGTVAGAAAIVKATGRQLPERVSWGDLVLTTVATHKVARLLAKDPVTSPLRAPFTRFAGTSGEAELAEEVRGTGPQKAIGELVTCPFCLGLWAATAFAFGLTLAPRPTRLAATVLTSVTAADVLQLAYAKAEEWATG